MSAGEVEVSLATAIEPTSAIGRDQQGFTPRVQDLSFRPVQGDGLTEVEEQPWPSVYR
jgi:hypothetical protein